MPGFGWLIVAICVLANTLLEQPLDGAINFCDDLRPPLAPGLLLPVKVTKKGRAVSPEAPQGVIIHVLSRVGSAQAGTIKSYKLALRLQPFLSWS